MYVATSTTYQLHMVENFLIDKYEKMTTILEFQIDG